MKQTLKSLLFLGVGSVSAHAGTAVADFNDLALGDLAGQAGGSGFAAAAWTNNTPPNPATTLIDLVSGDLGAPAGTNFALVQSGTPLSARNTVGTSSVQIRTLSTPLTGDTIWFSFLLNQPVASSGSNAGTRAGICFNQATANTTAQNPRIMALGSQLAAWLSAENQIVVNNVFTANTTALVLGKIVVNDASGGNETLNLWVNPNVNALGTSTGTFSGGNWVYTAGITSVGILSYGAAGTGDITGGFVDALRISDDPDAYTQVTGSTIPDPVLGVDPGSVAADYNFGFAYPGSTTRTVLFRNEGPNNSLTIENVSLTNNAGGVLSVDNVMPAVGSTLAPGETLSVRVLATSAAGGDFTGELSIDTDVDTQDKLLPVTVSVFTPGEKVNANPTFDAGLAGWTAAAAVAPGIAPGSPAMARVRGRGDKGLPLDETDSLGQATSIPDGAANWELGCFFTPVRSADFAAYTGAAPDGTRTDRTFQLAIFSGDNAASPSMTDTEALNALVQIAYLPAGNGITGEGFYAFDGSVWTRLAGLPAITGSIDSDADGLLEPGTDTIHAYRLKICGTNFGIGTASYSITLSGGELAAPVTQSDIVLSAGNFITSAGPGSYTFTTSDTSTLSNFVGGLCTPFWVDDVFYYATALPEPSLTVAGTLAINGFNEATPTDTLVVRNDGPSQNLNITGASFGDAALSLVSPALPVQVAPGATVTLQVQLNTAALVPDTALLSTLTLASNDPSQPTTEIPIAATSTTSQNLLPNWNFETPGNDTVGNTDNFAYWYEDLVRVLDVPGILPGSTTAAYLSATGATTYAYQTLASPVGDFDFQCGFAVRATADRAFNVLLSSGSGQINVRYQGAIWSAYNGATWEPLIDMSGAPLVASFDASFDGDFLDVGESFTAYRLHIIGSGWGTPTPTYQIEILNAAGSLLAAGAGPSTVFWVTPTGSGLRTITFSNQIGNNPGFWVDDVLLADVTSVVTPAEIRITGFSVNPTTGAISLTFTSTAGTPYSITASNDLGITDDFSEVATATGQAGSTTVNFTDVGANSQPRRFYRVEKP